MRRITIIENVQAICQNPPIKLGVEFVKARSPFAFCHQSVNGVAVEQCVNATEATIGSTVGERHRPYCEGYNNVRRKAHVPPEMSTAKCRFDHDLRPPVMVLRCRHRNYRRGRGVLVKCRRNSKLFHRNRTTTRARIHVETIPSPHHLAPLGTADYHRGNSAFSHHRFSHCIALSDRSPRRRCNANLVGTCGQRGTIFHHALPR